MHSRFEHIDSWIFDLDLTLYGPEANIMAQVRDRIALYVERHFNIGSDAAHQIRHTYWKKYGTTLGGLMAEHGVDPHGYLDFVHDVDMSLLQPATDLRDQIEALPGRKLIFTNADAPYAQRGQTPRARHPTGRRFSRRRASRPGACSACPSLPTPTATASNAA